jgi:hypothetical protein
MSDFYDRTEALLSVEYPRALNGDKIALDNCIVLLDMLKKGLGLDDA